MKHENPASPANADAVIVGPFKPHALCLAFPPLSKTDNDEGIESVKEHGQKEDIVLLRDPNGGEDMILDGRHRQEWCLAAGVKPRYRYFGSREGDGNSPTTFVWTVNTVRRHLPDTGVRAAIAAELQKFWRAEGGEDDAKADAAGTGSPQGLSAGEALSRAAGAMHVSETTVRKAADVMEHSPETFEKLKSGDVKLDEAHAEAKPKKKEAKAKKKGTAAAAITAANPLADEVRRTISTNARQAVGDELADAIEEKTALTTLEELEAFASMEAKEQKRVAPLLVAGKPLSIARRVMAKDLDKNDKLETALLRARGEGKKFVFVIDGMEITIRKAPEKKPETPAADPESPADPAPAAEAPPAGETDSQE